MRRHRIVLLILFSLCCVSLLLNFFLFSRAKQYYLELNRGRLDPLGFESHPIPESAGAVSFDGITVAFVGDSRAAAWSAPSMPADFRFTNDGVDAQTSAQVRYRFEQDGGRLRPDAVILQVGINDLKTIPLFPDQEAAIVERTKNNISEIVARARELDMTVILTTVFPAGEISLGRQLFWSPQVDAAIEDVNVYIRSLEAPGILVFDAYELLIGRPDRYDLYVDELHLNSAGYEVLNKHLVSVLTDLSFSSHEATTPSP